MATDKNDKEQNDKREAFQSIFRRVPKWQDLWFYQKSEVLYQMTFVFCERFLPKYGDRTVDQMVQAARSGKQNIVEGSEDGKPSERYERYFSDFTLDNFINLLLLKRTAFEHENEVRIFLIFDEDKDESKSMNEKDVTPKYISLDWLSIIEEIRVDSDCSDIEIALLQDEIDKLIDDSSRTDKEKKKLRSKLKVKTYDVNKDEHQEPHLKIGETYADYEKRL